MADINSAMLAEALSRRFSVAFEGSVENVAGGEFTVMRPSDLERGNGFGIVLGRTPRRIEALLSMDRFAGGLLRQMSEAEDEARSLFIRLLEDAGINNVIVTAAVNDIAVRTLEDLRLRDWTKVDIECERRLPALDGSGTSLDELAFEVAATCAGLALSLLPLEDAREFPPLFEEGLPEGAVMRVEVNRYERNRMNRATCIAHHGTSCTVCGFDFAATYGDLGKGFIEVHHKTPVSQMGGAYRVNPVADLAPVCPNCHAMLHQQNPPLSVEELKAMLPIARQAR